VFICATGQDLGHVDIAMENALAGKTFCTSWLVDIHQMCPRVVCSGMHASCAYGRV
jgi:hypothetical protein